MDPIRRFARLFRLRMAAKRRAPLNVNDVSIVHDRVWLTDIDELRHMNNGVYLSLLDHARLDLMLRSGYWPKLRAAKVYPIVTAQSITYRRSLQLGQRFQIESRILGYDERAVYLEQRVVAKGEIHARAFVQGLFLRNAGGVVPIQEVGDIVGVVTADLPAPAWLSEWAAQVRLPSTRQPAPSDWS
ncbi:MAG TPA: acyl-CoA thioesterase [Pseudolysinimonas sp.]|nr:acyl-CoA thioesterase [Pseudolysinimonas sp.]